MKQRWILHTWRIVPYPLSMFFALTRFLYMYRRSDVFIKYIFCKFVYIWYTFCICVCYFASFAVGFISFSKKKKKKSRHNMCSKLSFFMLVVLLHTSNLQENSDVSLISINYRKFFSNLGKWIWWLKSIVWILTGVLLISKRTKE